MYGHQCRFDLQRSADGINFSSIANISATQDRCAQPFDQVDRNPLAGINYYRLKSMDVDGKFSYSNIVKLIAKSQGFKMLTVSPNPVGRENVYLKLESSDKSTINISITDFSGRVVSKQVVQVNNGMNAILLPTTQLAAGAYQAMVYTANEKPQSIMIP
jgi:5-formaminoimidazole-4-carboxamide-1-beta-D-ribofuranosyl 5'-monophosphate synthetase